MKRLALGCLLICCTALALAQALPFTPVLYTTPTPKPAATPLPTRAVVPQNSAFSNDPTFTTVTTFASTRFDLPTTRTAYVPSSDYYAKTPRPYVYKTPKPNESYYGEISKNTGRRKTVYVEPYTRSDGTQVQGHYRSPPKR